MAAKVEHREGDQGVGGGEAKGHPGDQSDLGVDRFDASVGQAMFDRGEDRVAVPHDPALQCHERRDPAAAGPTDPPAQGRDGFLVG